MAQAVSDSRRDPAGLSDDGGIEIIKSKHTGPVLSITP